MSTLTGHRLTSYSVEVLNRNLGFLQVLDGVQPGGKVEWSASQAIQGTGSLVVIGQDINWDQVRLRIRTTVRPAVVPPEGADPVTWDLGVWIPVVPGDDWTPTGKSQPLQLLDLSSILERSGPAGVWGAPAGTNVTDLVKLIITDRGLRVSVTSSTLTLTAGLAWDPGVSWLKICNDLLKTINYRPVWADRAGIIRVQPYVAAANYVGKQEFVAGKNCIFSPTWSMRQDRDSVPTTLVLYTASTDETPSLIATYEPPLSSPWSTSSRGYTYQVTEQAEAATQAELNAMVKTRWGQLATPQTTREITHAPVPLDMGAGVRFASPRAGVDALHVVAKTSVTLKDTALQSTTLQEVAS